MFSREQLGRLHPSIIMNIVGPLLIKYLPTSTTPKYFKMIKVKLFCTKIRSKYLITALMGEWRLLLRCRLWFQRTIRQIRLAFKTRSLILETFNQVTRTRFKILNCRCMTIHLATNKQVTMIKLLNQMQTIKSSPKLMISIKLEKCLW